MTEDWKKIEAYLQGAYDFQKIPPIKERDIKIIDVWNSDEVGLNDQNYFFIGSRGSGKTTLLETSIQKIEEDNLDLKKNATLYCKIRSQDIFKSIEREYTERDLGRFIRILLKGIYESFDTIVDEKIKSGYFERIFSPPKFYRTLKKLEATLSDKSSVKSKIIRSIRSKIAEEFGSASFSIMDTGFVSFGKIEFSPLSITYKPKKKSDDKHHEHPDKEKKTDDKEYPPKKSIEEELDEKIVQCLGIIEAKAKKSSIKKCFIFIDDFQFLPLHFQINFIQILLFISQHLTRNGIVTAFKIFSSHDTTTDIAAVLSTGEKELTPRHLEATLEVIDVKRRALESLLIRVLCAEDRFKESEVQNFFTREIIDAFVILSGGHPRRFLQIASRFMNLSKGVKNENVHNFLMLSAVEVIHSSRKALGVLLGIVQGIELDRYKKWYQETLSNLVNWVVSGQQDYFFLISLKQLRRNFELEQWLSDAIAIGDILEIERKRIIDKEVYRLIAINPATLGDYMGANDKPILHYNDVVDIQTGSYKINKIRKLKK